MLKAKFSLTAEQIQTQIVCLQQSTKPFIVEPVTYNEKQCNVVSDDLSIMHLIAALAAENTPALLDVSRL